MDKKLLISLQTAKAHKFLDDANEMVNQKRWDYNSVAEVTEAEVLEMAPLSANFIANVEALLSTES